MSENAIAIGLGLVGGILILAALSNSNEEEPVAQPQPESLPAPKSPDQIEAEKVGDLLQQEHYPEAVSKACKILFGLIRRKSGIKDKDTMKLIDHVFAPKKPVLRFTRHDEYAHLNSHEGYYFLLKGISSAFRNPAGHENIKMYPGEAMAQISTIGHLYDIIEKHTAKVQDDLLQTIAEKTTQRLQGDAA